MESARKNARCGQTLTWKLIDGGGRSGREPLAGGVDADPPSLQQSLQRFGLAGLMLTSQPGAASAGVDAARLPEAQRASHAAAAARLADLLHAVLGQRLAQKTGSGVARLALDNGSDRT